MIVEILGEGFHRSLSFNFSQIKKLKLSIYITKDIYFDINQLENLYKAQKDNYLSINVLNNEKKNKSGTVIDTEKPSYLSDSYILNLTIEYFTSKERTVQYPFHLRYQSPQNCKNVSFFSKQIIFEKPIIFVDEVKTNVLEIKTDFPLQVPIGCIEDLNSVLLFTLFLVLVSFLSLLTKSFNFRRKEGLILT